MFVLLWNDDNNVNLPKNESDGQKKQIKPDDGGKPIGNAQGKGSNQEGGRNPGNQAGNGGSNGKNLEGGKPNQEISDLEAKPEAELTPTEKEIVALQKEIRTLLKEKEDNVNDLNARNGMFRTHEIHTYNPLTLT